MTFRYRNATFTIEDEEIDFFPFQVRAVFNGRIDKTVCFKWRWLPTILAILLRSKREESEKRRIYIVAREWFRKVYGRVYPPVKRPLTEHIEVYEEKL